MTHFRKTGTHLNAGNPAHTHTSYTCTKSLFSVIINHTKNGAVQKIMPNVIPNLFRNSYAMYSKETESKSACHYFFRQPI